jgi:hypothetical protein
MIEGYIDDLVRSTKGKMTLILELLPAYSDMALEPQF